MAGKIDIWQLWLALKSNTNTKQGGHLRLRDFNSWVEQASLEIFKESIEQWQKTQFITDDIRTFLVSTTTTTKKTTKNYRLLEYPKDYAFFSSARIFMEGEEVVKCPELGGEEPPESILADLCEVGVTYVDNARWGNVCNHKIIPPSISKSRVFITQFDEGFKVAPKEVGYITIDYFRYPKKAELKFLASALPDQEYDSANTNQMEWNDTVQNKFLARLEVFYSKFIREPFLLGAGMKKVDSTV